MFGSKKPKVRTPGILTDFLNEKFYPGYEGLSSKTDSFHGFMHGVTFHDKEGNPIGRAPGILDLMRDAALNDFSGDRTVFLHSRPSVTQDKGYNRGFFYSVSDPKQPKFQQVESIGYNNLLNETLYGDALKKFNMPLSPIKGSTGYNIQAGQANVEKFQTSRFTRQLGDLAKDTALNLSATANSFRPESLQAHQIDFKAEPRRHTDTQDDFEFMMNRATAAANARAGQAAVAAGATGRRGGTAQALLAQIETQAAADVAQAAFQATTAARQTAIAQQQLRENQYQFDVGTRKDIALANAELKKTYDLANLNKDITFSLEASKNAGRGAEILAGLFSTSGQLDLGGYNTWAGAKVSDAQLKTQAAIESARLTEQGRQADNMYALQAGALNSQNLQNMLGFITQNRGIDASTSLQKYGIEADMFKNTQNLKLGLAQSDVASSQVDLGFRQLQENARQFNLGFLLKEKALTLEGLNMTGISAYNTLTGNLNSFSPMQQLVNPYFQFAATQMQTKAQVDSASKSGAGSLLGLGASMIGMPLLGFNPITGATLGTGLFGGGAQAEPTKAGK